MTGKKVLLILPLIVIAGGLIGWYFQKPATNIASFTQNSSPTKPIITSTVTETDVPAATVIAGNLDTPWGIAFLPDSSLLITERRGRVSMVNKDGNIETIADLDQVLEIGEGGLLGIALHPDFTTNNQVYVYYTYSGNGNNTVNRVSTFTYRDERLIGEKIIVDQIPGASNHNGGRIKFGPDKLLYITTGDAQEPSLAQDTNSLAGKILRVTPEGRAAPGNPFNNLVYSYGHRNSQGIAWNQDGSLWSTEHGRSSPTGYDEINRIELGKNYGWPDSEGDTVKSGTVSPKRHSGDIATWAPAGGAFAGNSLFFGGLRGQALYEAVIDNGQVTEIKEHFKGELGRIRDVVLGPDNMLYITTSNLDGRGTPKAGDDKVIRINPLRLAQQ